MQTLNRRKLLQLFVVTEYSNRSNSQYDLKLVDYLYGSPIFYQTKLDEKLDELLHHFYGGGMYFKVVNEPLCSDSGPNLQINVGNDRFIIDDLRGRINIDSKKSTYYVLVDRRNLKHRWVVAQECGNVYTSMDEPLENDKGTPF
jgi:hypothetical protein